MKTIEINYQSQLQEQLQEDVLTWAATLKPLPEKYGCAYVVDDNGLKNDVSRLCDIIIARCKENEKAIA